MGLLTDQFYKKQTNYYYGCNNYIPNYNSTYNASYNPSNNNTNQTNQSNQSNQNYIYSTDIYTSYRPWAVPGGNYSGPNRR
jgi:hypothetical protein